MGHPEPSFPSQDLNLSHQRTSKNHCKCCTVREDRPRVCVWNSGTLTIPYQDEKQENQTAHLVNHIQLRFGLRARRFSDLSQPTETTEKDITRTEKRARSVPSLGRCLRRGSKQEDMIWPLDVISQRLIVSSGTYS